MMPEHSLTGEGSRPLSKVRWNKVRFRALLKLIRTRRTKTLFVDLFYIAPQYFLYLSLQILPFLVALPILFTDQLDFSDSDINFVGLANVLGLFKQPLVELFLPALQRTVTFWLISYAMVFLFGFTLALAMYELVSRMKGLFFTIIYLPWMVSGIGIGLLMVMLFSRNTGTVSLGFQELGFASDLFDVKTETASAIALPVIYGWKTAGFNMALFLGGLLTIPRETIESAKMDGANYVQRVVYVYVPQIIPSIIIATIFVMINSFGIFDELVGLGALEGNKNARLVSVLIWEMGFGTAVSGTSRIGTMAQGVTVSMVVFVPLVIVAFYLNKLQKKLHYN